MSGAVSAISNAVAAPAKAIGGAVSGVGNALGGGSIAQGITHLGNDVQNNPLSYTGAMSGGVGGALIGSAVDNALGSGTQPTAPGIDPAVAAAQAAQQKQAVDFRNNMGANEQNAFQSLAHGANQQLGQNLSTINKNNSARGLGYGGINQGQQQSARANEQSSLAQGRENINDQYNTAANQMDSAAIGTGLAVQQSQQTIQNQIYQQAMQNMMNQNSAFGSLAQGAATVGSIAAFA